MSHRGAWALSGLVSARLGDGARARATWPWPGVRHAIVRMSAWLELVGGLGRIGAGGDAVVCLMPPRPTLRLVAVMLTVAGVLAAIIVTAGIAWWPAAAVMALAGALLFMARPGVVMWRCRRPAWRLRGVVPPGAWCLRNFASRRKRAGRALLDEVCADADVAGRALWLDTTEPDLVRYYRDFDFDVAASQVMCWGAETATLYRMVRPCS